MVGRSIASTLMWMAYLGIVAGLAGGLGNWVILLAFILMIPLIVMTGMMWGAFGPETTGSREDERSQDSIEKRKRERLDDVLRNLSDEDLLRLKQRLSTGAIDDADLYNNLVGDDGELVDYSG